MTPYMVLVALLTVGWALIWRIVSPYDGWEAFEVLLGGDLILITIALIAERD